MEISGGIDICQMSFPTGATAILLLVCILSLLSTKCPAASILRSARFSRMQTTKKPHGYHKIAVWQKDDRIRKSPLKFYAQYYSILSEDFQALIITELWSSNSSSTAEKNGDTSLFFRFFDGIGQTWL